MTDDVGPVDEPSDLESTWSSPATESPDRIGPYRVLERIGEGGMGVVYLAEQTSPVRRRVALKVIRRGMDTATWIARFEAERQALALMDHPAVARIYDAGMTPDGRPYFAMEFVQGLPINEHCDRQRLTNRERLDLFLQVCEGVQHAHHKAVIHRDLKPSNVLVSVQDGHAAVKIIDFGLAKALGQPLTERTLHTELGVLIGTPAYMSPEQAEMSGQDVDTRTDVYALGVMLYELLVGALPFEADELREAGLDEIRRRIREVDPPKPSARLATLGDRSTESARHRRTEPAALRRELQGDLDRVTMKALEKDRARRYGSPSEMAEDVRRHLRDEPVLAHAPSAGYRARKFVRRHRVGVTAAAVMVLGLAAGTVGSAVGLVEARRAEVRATQEARAKGEVADFLKNLFKVSNPSEALGNRVTARELLDKAAKTIDTQLADQPEIRAELAAIMGEVYLNLGLYAPAEALTRAALETRKQVLGAEHPATLASRSALASVLWKRGKFADAERLHAETLEARKRVLGPEHVDTLASMNNLANAYWSQGHYPEAEKLHAETLAIRRRVLGPEHSDTLSSMKNLALAYQQSGRLADAERLLSEALEIGRRVDGPEHPRTLLTMHNLANVYGLEKRYPAAERLFSEAISSEKRILGPEHPSTLDSMNNLAELMLIQRRFPDAERMYAETLEIKKRALGPEAYGTLAASTNLANTYCKAGRPADAARLASQTLETEKRVLGPEHPATLYAATVLANSYVEQRRYPEAERMYASLLEIRTRTLGAGSTFTLEMMIRLARVSALRGDRPMALTWLRRAVDSGFGRSDYVTGDAAFDSVRGPELDALMLRARRDAQASQSSVGGDRAK